MAVRDKRFEARVDAETDALITEAARLSRRSKSAFVTEAARRAAEQVVARADVTLMDPLTFDRLIDSLDVPDEAPELADALARLPRLT